MKTKPTESELRRRIALVEQFDAIFNRAEPSACDSCARLTKRAELMIESRDKRIERLTRRIEILEESAALAFEGRP